MSKNINKRLFLVVFTLSVILSQNSYASSLLSINSLDGGGSGIRFERIIPGLNNSKKLQIRMSNTDGSKYQIFQRVLEPIVNEKGQALNLSAIQVATLGSSNTSGMLYMQSPDHLSFSDQLIYSSGQTGQGDSFMIAYSADPKLIGGSGNYRGKMLFTVRSSGSGGQDETIVDFSLEAVSQLQISVEGGHEPRTIRIKDSDTSQEKADFAKISFSNNGSGDIKIYQEVNVYPTNQTSTEMPSDVIRASVEGSSQNIRSLDDAGLSHSRTLIYAGAVDNDDLIIYFLIDPKGLSRADAGRYVGQIKYIIESSQGQKEFILGVECEIQPIFTINVNLPSEGVSFGHVLASSPAQEKQAQVVVSTNLHKPYQVMQSMVSLMTNKEGKEFDKNHFTFKVGLDSEQKGGTRYQDFSPIERGEYPIYSSNSSGDPVMFTVTYKIQGYFDMSPGDFIAPLKFSLNQN